jgi:sirohydrochlorin ferrochelatase
MFLGLGAVLLLGPMLAFNAVSYGVYGVAEGVSRLRSRKRARIEAELDRTSHELRATMYALAKELSDAGHDARKEMIRQSFLASGKVLPQS